MKLHKLSFERWVRVVQAVVRSRVDEVGEKRLQELIESGIELKREGKIRSHDEWDHAMWMLKKKQRELTSQTRSLL